MEVLSSSFAEQFTLFEYGDIVVSLRELSSIVVLDSLGKTKWLCTGIFTKQHDPDFEQNGWITVFDNRAGLGRSMIREINPISNEVKTLYPTNQDQVFYSMVGGKHQKLNNGNRLITETCAGRVFEISPEGETIWEWI
ncbi:MAG: arylsulfotransferase family protein [Candidatus Marinimicrobia bacterium]|nr:arylsulfotransferase family protein [Candidatus Neomarinimicrobiota bacterium]